MAERQETTADIIAQKRKYANEIERKALTKILNLTNSLDEDCAVDPVEIRDIAKAALAAPPRNCDMYANYNDAMKAFEAFVREQGKLGFINPYTEAFKWLFAPTTEQEGGKDGNE